MLRLIKYLKPYVLQILLTIGLLFVLANTDLAAGYDYKALLAAVGHAHDREDPKLVG